MEFEWRAPAFNERLNSITCFHLIHLLWLFFVKKLHKLLNCPVTPRALMTLNVQSTANIMKSQDRRSRTHAYAGKVLRHV